MMKIPGLLLSLCCLIVNGASGVDTDIVSVSVMEGDSVTLNTGVQINQQKQITWYYNGIRIAQINGDLSNICTDVQCNDDTERFRDRLKLDPQTGSLVIINIRNTDSGEYTLKISRGSSDREKIFSVSVTGASGVDTDEVSVMEGDSVTLNTGVQSNQHEKITWYYNGTHIAQINRDQSKICTDVQCNEDTERFRDRLELDHQTGSLIITHTTTEDSGKYQLQISNSRLSILKTFRVTVTDVPDSGLSSAAIGGICVAVILLAAAAAAAGIYCLYRSNNKGQTGNRTTNNNIHQGNGLDQMPHDNNTSQDVTNETPLLHLEDTQTDANSPQTSPAETEGDGLDQTSDENSTSQDATNVRCEALLHREDPQTDAANSPQTSPAEAESEDPQTDANSPQTGPAEAESEDPQTDANSPQTSPAKTEENDHTDIPQEAVATGTSHNETETATS